MKGKTQGEERRDIAALTNSLSAASFIIFYFSFSCPGSQGISPPGRNQEKEKQEIDMFPSDVGRAGSEPKWTVQLRRRRGPKWKMPAQEPQFLGLSSSALECSRNMI